MSFQDILHLYFIQDKEENNARVSKINLKSAADEGVRIGSYVTAVNSVYVYGFKHRDIITCFNNAQFPITLTFRHLPKLLVISQDRNMSRNSKNLTGKGKIFESEKSKKKIFKWLSR